jgi:hypothetical protein
MWGLLVVLAVIRRLLGGGGQASGALTHFTFAFAVEGDVEAPETYCHFGGLIGVMTSHLELEELHRKCARPLPCAPTVGVLNLAPTSTFLCACSGLQTVCVVGARFIMVRA